MKIKGVKGLIHKKIKKLKMIKKYVGLSLVFLWTVWGQFIFR